MSAYFGRSARIVVALLVLPLISGCSQYYFEEFNIDGPRAKSATMDAKQRLLLVTHEGGKSRDRKIVCAEPSPDAFSVSAASAAASAAANTPGTTQGAGATNVTGGGAASRSEAGASLAMRTQTVQLLRDGLYRACEAYMNGAIDQFQYNVLLVNMDRLMTTLMGIDAIGGTQNVAPVAINAVAPGATSKEVAGSGNQPAVNESNAPAGTGTVKDPVVKNVYVTPAGAVQAEAITNIILAAHAHNASPALCISLLASGEMRLDNPGQQSVLRSCDYLLNGTMHNIVAAKGRPTAPTSYKVSDQAANAAVGHADSQHMAIGEESTAGGTPANKSKKPGDPS
jgi:hypothetical protein